MANSVPPHRQQPTRFPCPWDSSGKNTGEGCHFLLQCMKVKSESEVTQSCPTLCNLMNRSTPGLLVHHQLWSSLKLMSIELVMPSSHLILRHPLLLLPPNTFFKFMQIVLGCVSILVLTFSHYPCILKMHPFHSVCMLLVSSSLGLELHIYLSTSPV